MGVFALAAIRLKPIANSLVQSIITMRFQKDSVMRLSKDFDFGSSPKSSVSHKQSENLTLETFSLENIRFCFPGITKPVLDDVSMKIRSGETIGLIGPSGSGKTTMVDVLLGLLEPDSGNIKLNGKPAKENFGAWRSQVTYLPQLVFLIDHSLRCNVALGEKEADIDETRLKRLFVKLG